MRGSIHHRMERMEFYNGVVAAWLNRRGSHATDWFPHPRYPHHERYVVQMCEDLLNSMHESGFPGARLEDIFRIDASAAGHVDY